MYIIYIIPYFYQGKKKLIIIINVLILQRNWKQFCCHFLQAKPNSSSFKCNVTTVLTYSDIRILTQKYTLYNTVVMLMTWSIYSDMCTCETYFNKICVTCGNKFGFQLVIQYKDRFYFKRKFVCKGSIIFFFDGYILKFFQCPEAKTFKTILLSNLWLLDGGILSLTQIQSL